MRVVYWYNMEQIMKRVKGSGRDGGGGIASGITELSKYKKIQNHGGVRDLPS